MNTQPQKTARFDLRLSPDRKKFFEYASELAGFKTLSEFMVSTVQLKAAKIVKQHNAILASQKDKEIFFDALANPPKPSDELKKAVEKYSSRLTG